MKLFTLRKKTYVMIVLVTWVTLIAAYAIFKHEIISGLTYLEDKHIAQDMSRVHSAIEDNFYSLDATEGDWAMWDDTYNYLLYRDPDYIVSNMPNATLTNLHLNFMIFLDTSGRIVFGKGVDLDKELEIPVPPDLIKHFTANKAFFYHTELDKTNTGFIKTDQGIVLVASRPITTNDQSKPSAGNLIMGLYFNDEKIAELGRETQLSIKLIDPHVALKGKEIIDEKSKLHMLVQLENDQIIKAWTPLIDIYGNKIALLEVENTRDFFQQGQKSLFYLLGIIIIAGLVLLGIALFLLERIFLARIEKLGGAVRKVTADGNASSRVFVPGRDELVFLADSINEMLETIEASQQDLRASEEKFRNVYDQMPIGLVLFDTAGVIAAANQAYIDEFSLYNKESLIGKNIQDDSNLPEEIKTMLFPVHLTQPGTVIDFYLSDKMVLTTINKTETKYLEWRVNPIQIKNQFFHGYLGQVHNITEKKQAEEHLKYLTLFDLLTGIYNRAFFEDEMDRMGQENYEHVSVIICDLDGLKLVNDTFGHEAGDSLLKAAAQVLRDCFPKEHVVARIGGDEFAMLLPGINLSDGEKALNRIHAAIESYNEDTQTVMPLSLSLGLATTRKGKMTMRELLKEADYNMYREKLHHKKSSRNDLLRILTRAMKARDIITELHGERLQELVVALGRATGIPESSISDLRLFAQFHDIGKVGVPDAILFKPGNLTQDEYREMRRHSEIGYRIAKSSQDLLPIAHWILHHHEWWNGTGYPSGLKENEIPLESRILALADAYDAMTNDRPYRKSYTHNQALDEIRKYSGIQFDPVLVNKFIELLEGDPYLFERIN